MTFPIIGILGPAGSGKDLVADFFEQKGFAKVAFSDPMKRFVQYLFNLDDEQLWGPSEARNEEFAVTEEEWVGLTQRLEQEGWEFVEELKIKLHTPALCGLWSWLGMLYEKHHDAISPRIILQTIGTEWGRKQEPLLWVNYLHQSICPDLQGGFDYSQQEGVKDFRESLFAGVVIPDHRFANEVMATREHGGFMIRVSRPGRPQELRNPGVQKHPSEEEQKTLASDFFHLELELPEGVDNVYAILDDIYQAAPWSRG